jgi:hypothetical protein
MIWEYLDKWKTVKKIFEAENRYAHPQSAFIETVAGIQLEEASQELLKPYIVITAGKPFLKVSFATYEPTTIDIELLFSYSTLTFNETDDQIVIEDAVSKVVICK